MRRKQELIRQIRELEKIPIQRTKGFDPTEAGGHGLLEEMSMLNSEKELNIKREKSSKRQNEKDKQTYREKTKKPKNSWKLLPKLKRLEIKEKQRMTIRENRNSRHSKKWSRRKKKFGRKV